MIQKTIDELSAQIDRARDDIDKARSMPRSRRALDLERFAGIWLYNLEKRLRRAQLADERASQ